MIFGRQQFSDALAGVNERAWSELSLHQVGPRPSIKIHQNRMCTFATFGARVAQKQRPISSNLGQKCLGIGFEDRGRTSAFYPLGVPVVGLLSPIYT